MNTRTPNNSSVEALSSFPEPTGKQQNTYGLMLTLDELQFVRHALKSQEPTLDTLNVLSKIGQLVRRAERDGE